MNEPRNDSYEPTAAGSYTDPRLADRSHLPDAARDHDLATTGVDVDGALEESADDGLHEGHHHELHDRDHEHPHDHLHEHDHEPTTTGVDVDAALERAVEHEI